MKLTQYQVDAFTDQLFAGNPAAVCPLDTWLDDALMQDIAAENNLSETAFFVPVDAGFDLRWFTPSVEVDLCGHATLATAHVIFTRMNYAENDITFHTRSGELHVSRAENMMRMDFPAEELTPCNDNSAIEQALGAATDTIYSGSYYVAVYAEEDQIRALVPDFNSLRQLDRPVAITAPGREVDFVSRFFAPGFGIDEDPVTGSAHCLLAPYWSKQTGKTILTARQLSQRGGSVTCEVQGDRVILQGQAVLFMVAQIELPDS